MNAVFLDRDDTLIDNGGDLGDPRGVVLLPGVPAACAALRDAGYVLVVVSNQAGVARGVFSEADVDAVNAEIARQIDAGVRRRGLIEKFYYCPYHPQGTVERYRRDHPWRKPAPGMILAARDDLGIDLGASWLVGDAPRDTQAGNAAGCRTILLGAHDTLPSEAAPTAGAADLPAAVRIILEGRERSRGGGKRAP